MALRWSAGADDTDSLSQYYPASRPSLVGAAGFEPTTSCTPCRRATKLRYAPSRMSIDPRRPADKGLVVWAAGTVELTDRQCLATATTGTLGGCSATREEGGGDEQ